VATWSHQTWFLTLFLVVSFLPEAEKVPEKRISKICGGGKNVTPV
jgi:hypothetical protein